MEIKNQMLENCSTFRFSPFAKNWICIKTGMWICESGWIMLWFVVVCAVFYQLISCFHDAKHFFFSMKWTWFLGFRVTDHKYFHPFLIPGRCHRYQRRRKRGEYPKRFIFAHIFCDFQAIARFLVANNLWSNIYRFYFW